jgi:spermidine synthase
MQTQKSQPLAYLYFCLFFISGISGLIYESIWSQYLKQFLGHAAYSQTLVLVIYMGGMALGSWLAAARASKFRNLLMVYAVVEVALGISALVFHDIFIRYLDVSFSVIIPALNKPLPIALYKWFTASLIILPQSMLLGATFPLMAGGILRGFPGLSGYKTSVIYFVNTMGASLGVLVSGFYLVKIWGLKGAIISAGILDLFVGVCVMLLCLKERFPAKTSVGEESGSGDTPPPPQAPPVLPKIILPADKRALYYPLMWISAITAASSFIYEIGWIRMLSIVLGSSTHSFELMLSAFILGLALGSFFVRNKLDTIQNAPRFLGLVQIIMGASALATLFTYGSMFGFMAFTLDGLAKSSEGYLLFNIMSHVICMIIMLPSTICAGMVIPLIIHMLYKNGFGEQSIGKVYAVNTFGGIAGVAAAVWILMPLVGLKYLIIAGGAIDMALGLYILYRFSETRESLLRTVMQPMCVMILLAAFAFSKVDLGLISSGVFRYGTIAVSKSKRIVEHKDGRTASITLFRSGVDNLVLSTNGKPDASVGTGEEFSSDEYTMALLGVLPLSVRFETKRAAVIGMGAGMTAHYMLYDPDIQQLDVVEIEPAMVKLAKRIGPKVENTFNDPRCNIYIEDAKTFFSAQNRTYDVIVSEPSNPWVSGVSSLFSKEFFDHIRNHLNDNGILVQWFHKYEADITILVSILKALAQSFPVYEMYTVGSDLLIIAGPDSSTDISLKRDVFAIAPMAENLAKMGFSGLDDFKLINYANQDFLNALINTYDTPANSDYHSYVDLYAAGKRFMGSHISEIDHIRDFIIPVRRIVFGDTSYMSLSPSRLLPDIYNMIEIQNAKLLSQQLIISGRDDDSSRENISGSVFILDYTYARPHKVTFSQIQSAIIQILQKTLPYLSADEMREVWDVIEMKISRWDFSDDEMEWIDYFKALCVYNIPEIRRLSIELLPADSISDHYSNQMLITSLFAASAVLNDTTKLERIWNKYDEKMDPPAAIRAAKAFVGRGQNINK